MLFTDFSFIFVASYIELPFMILPIFNVLDDMDNNLINASYDLGATIGRPSVMSSSLIDEWSPKWGSVCLYSKLESLHADPFDRWEPRHHPRGQQLSRTSWPMTTTEWVQPSVWFSSWPCSSPCGWPRKGENDEKICQPLSGTGLFVLYLPIFLPDWLCL